MAVPDPHRSPKADRDLEWDWSGNAAAYSSELLERGGWRTLARAHAWHETTGDSTGPPQRKSAYKLPHHRVIGGRTRVVLKGVRSAMNILAATRFDPENYRIDLPAGEVADVYEHLAVHLEQFREEPPEIMKGWSASDGWPPR